MFDPKIEPEDMFAAAEGAPTPAAPSVPAAPAAPQPSPAPFAPAAPAAPAAPRPVYEAPAAVFETPVKTMPSAPTASAAPKGSGFPLRPVLIVVGSIAVIALAGVISYYSLSSRTAPTPGVPDISKAVDEAAVDENEGEVPAADETVPAEVVVPSGEIIPTPAAAEEPDTDKDGLTDAQEAELGTSPSKVDTDDDGLFDLEEVEIYHTNPLNPDSDGDTYLDGKEVSGGYDPNGPGKLLEVPASE